MEEDLVKFNLETIDKTLAEYKKNNIYDGVVVSKKEDGVIFNIGGKKDAFIKKDDFDDFNQVKIGERFKVVVLGTKTEDGYFIVSKKQAQDIIEGAITAESLKIGSEFNFFISDVTKDGSLISKLGLYTIIIPKDHTDPRVFNSKKYLNTQVKAIVIEFNRETKRIVASIRLLKEQIRENAEHIFWNSVFLNKIVEGTVEKIMPYGAFVDLDGIPAFIHISDLSWKKTTKVEEILTIGERYSFRIVKLDKENKKVSVGLKQNSTDPKFLAMKNLKFSEVYSATVVKILAFGCIVRLDECEVEGLLHINDMTENKQKRIYELVKVDDKINVVLKEYDEEKQRVSFKLV